MPIHDSGGSCSSSSILSRAFEIRSRAKPSVQFFGTSSLPKPTQPEAEACFRRALAVAREQGAKLWELRAATSLARSWREQGNLSEARDLLATVYGWFTEGFEAQDLRNAKSLLDQLNAG